MGLGSKRDENSRSSFTQKLKVETGSMEVAALFGLLGLGYGVSKIGKTPEISAEERSQASTAAAMAQNYKAAQRRRGWGPKMSCD